MPENQTNTIFMPNISTGGDNSISALPQRDIDPNAAMRGVKIQEAAAIPGQSYWRATSIKWLDEKTSQGRHHIYGNLTKDGALQAGVPLKATWSNGSAPVKTEDKSKDYPPFNYWYNFPMDASLNDYSIQVDDGKPSDVVSGIGMGANGNSHLHTCTVVDFELVTMPAVQQPSQPVQPQQPVIVPPLAHPITDPAKRIVSQPFGAQGEDYAKFGLAGHNGIDFAVPEGTPIVAVDDGIAVEVMEDPTGYGKYVKLIHAWGESLYAHLSHQDIPQGAKISRRVQIGLSGNTGNSTGPHLHFGQRVNPYQRGYPYDGYIDPAPYLPKTIIDAGSGPFLPGQPQPAQDSHKAVRDTYLKWFRQYGTQFGIEWHLLAALAYAENKYQVQPASQARAMGLMQFMPATWADMQKQLGVSDPLDPEQSIKAAAYYLVQIRSYLTRFGRYTTPWILAGYNWGIGNTSNATWEQVPPETKAYAGEIIEISEVLRRWEDGW